MILVDETRYLCITHGIELYGEAQGKKHKDCLKLQLNIDIEAEVSE